MPRRTHIEVERRFVNGVEAGPRRFGDTWPAPPPYGEAARRFEEENQARILAQRAEYDAEQRRLAEERRAENERKAAELRAAIEAWELAPEREAAERERSVLELEMAELDERQGQIERRLRAIGQLCRRPTQEDFEE
jgi:hypothetical protein